MKRQFVFALSMAVMFTTVACHQGRLTPQRSPQTATGPVNGWRGVGPPPPSWSAVPDGQ
jgi:hypothetical protein